MQQTPCTQGAVHTCSKRGTSVPHIKADDVELSTSQFVHKPERHGASLDADLGVFSRMPPDCPFNLPWVGGALAAPQPATSLVYDADRRQLLRHVQTNKSGH
jgi:hypothetical protein